MTSYENILTLQHGRHTAIDPRMSKISKYSIYEDQQLGLYLITEPVQHTAKVSKGASNLYNVQGCSLGAMKHVTANATET